MISKFVEALAEGMLFYRNNANKRKHTDSGQVSADSAR